MTAGLPRFRWSTLGVALGLQWKTAPIASTFALAATVGTGSMGAVGAWLTRQLLDELAHHPPDRGRALALAGSTSVAAAVAMLLLHGTQYANVILRQRVARAVDRTLFARVVGLETVGPFEDPAFHARLRMAEQAAQDAPAQVADLLQAVLRSGVAVGTLLVAVGLIAPGLAAVLAVVGMAGLATRIWRTRCDAAMQARLVRTHRWRDFYRALMLDVRAAREIRLFGLGDLFLGRMARTHDDAGREELAVERTGLGVHLALTGSTAVLTAGGAILAVDAAVSGRLGIGDVTLFLAAMAGIQTAMTGLVNQVGQAGRVLLVLESYRSLVEDRVESRSDRASVLPLAHGIELRDVWFRYHPDGPWVLRGVNLFVARGRSLGLVGVNGAGKSTLVKLLCRFHDPDRGQILWDGIDLRDLDPAALRARMSATFQDFMTYDLTAAENIGLGDLARLHDEPAIRVAARETQVDQALTGLPAGYATPLSRVLGGEDDEDAVGASLSGGQWQRVALARSLMRQEADLVLLDEPSAALDPESEDQIHRALHRYAEGRTCVLVSHRLNALHGADAIAVLADGRVVEQGTHGELMGRQGAYARLFGLQARGYQLGVA